jgi:hypothetical protein
MQGQVADIDEYCDGWAMHRYQPDYETYLDEYLTEIDGFANTDIWVTEMGWSSRNGSAVSDAYSWSTTMTYQTVATNLQTFYDDIKDRVKAIFFYHIHDFTAVGANNSRENFFGALSYDTAWCDWMDMPYISDKVRSLIATTIAGDPNAQWFGVSDAFSGVPTGAWSTADKQITRRRDLPDTAHVPVGQGSALTHYRRLAVFSNKLSGSHNLASLPLGLITLQRGVSEWPSSGAVVIGGKRITYTSRGFNDQSQVGYLAGCSASTGTYANGTDVELQSTYDASAGNTNIRTMLIRDSVTTDNTFYRFQPGMLRKFYVSVRCSDILTSGSDSVVWQFKQKPDASMPPILAMYETPDGFLLRHNVSRIPIDLIEWDSGDGVDKTVWTRWAFEVLFDSDPAVGYVQVYADFDNSGTLDDVSSGKIYAQTCYAEGNADGVGTVCCVSVGPYQQAGEGPGLWRDYSGVQVVDNG